MLLVLFLLLKCFFYFFFLLFPFLLLFFSSSFLFIFTTADYWPSTLSLCQALLSDHTLPKFSPPPPFPPTIYCVHTIPKRHRLCFLWHHIYTYAGRAYYRMHISESDVVSKRTQLTYLLSFTYFPWLAINSCWEKRCARKT